MHFLFYLLAGWVVVAAFFGISALVGRPLSRLEGVGLALAAVAVFVYLDLKLWPRDPSDERRP